MHRLSYFYTLNSLKGNIIAPLPILLKIALSVKIKPTYSGFLEIEIRLALLFFKIGSEYKEEEVIALVVHKV